MKNGKRLSVCLSCSNPISLDFPLKECILSVIPIADEIVLINGDLEGRGGEVANVVADLQEYSKEFGDWEGNFVEYHLPWRDSFRKNMHGLSITAAISQCTKDYILWLDADEIIHEQDHKSILSLMNFKADAYSFRTIHFYRDYEHYKIPKGNWYNHRPKFFKNNLGIWDGYQSWLELGADGRSFVRREYTSDLITWDYKPVHSFAIKVKIPIYHYGWVRHPSVMLLKQNSIERRHHPDWKDWKSWEWDMKDTDIFEGSHPKVMADRLERK